MNLEGQYIFTKVVEHGSFTESAKALGIPKSAVSQKIKKLEEQLNTTLIERTTRTIKLTPVGEAFYERTKAMLSKALEAESVIEEFQGMPTGVLQIAAVLDMGNLFLFDAIGKFSRTYPKLKIETHWTNVIRDYHLENFDVCFKLGPLTENHYSRKIAYQFNLGIFASKQFIAENPRLCRIQFPQDLKAFPWISYRTNRYNRPLHWHIATPGQEPVSIELEGNITVNSVHACANIMLAGAGLAVIPKEYLDSHSAKDQCKNIFPDWVFPKGEIYAVYRENKFLQPKIRLFLEQL